MRDHPSICQIPIDRNENATESSLPVALHFQFFVRKARQPRKRTMVAAASLTVRHMLAIAGTSSLFVLFLSYREVRWTNKHTGAATATAGSSFRTANRTTDTAALYKKEIEPVSSVMVKTTTQTPPRPASSSVVVPTTPTKRPDDNDKPWPKLNELISGDGNSIVADVQFVLDFAIIGRTCVCRFCCC
jgi:hypothetical protein